jgi:hypothetical protein
MRLINSHGAIESYSFGRDGSVAVSFGSADAMASPLYSWRIRGGRLQILDGTRIDQEFTLLAMDAKTLTVRRASGDIAKFSYDIRPE